MFNIFLIIDFFVYFGIKINYIYKNMYFCILMKGMNVIVIYIYIYMNYIVYFLKKQNCICEVFYKNIKRNLRNKKNLFFLNFIIYYEYF